MNEFSFLCSHSASLEVYQLARVFPSLTVAHGCGVTTSSAMVGTVVVATFDASYFPIAFHSTIELHERMAEGIYIYI